MNLQKLVEKRMLELDISNKRDEIAKKFENFLGAESVLDEENNIDIESENCLNSFRVVISFNCITFFFNEMYLKDDNIICKRQVEYYKLNESDLIIKKIIDVINKAEIVDQDFIFESLKV